MPVIKIPRRRGRSYPLTPSIHKGLGTKSLVAREKRMMRMGEREHETEEKWECRERAVLAIAGNLQDDLLGLDVFHRTWHLLGALIQYLINLIFPVSRSRLFSRACCFNFMLLSGKTKRERKKETQQQQCSLQ